MKNSFEKNISSAEESIKNQKGGILRNISIAIIILFITFLIIRGNLNISNEQNVSLHIQQDCREICGKIKKGETLFNIFKKYQLDVGELLKIKEASADIHRLKELYPGQTYKIVIDDNNQVNSLTYWIDDNNILNITRTQTGFAAEKPESVCAEDLCS